MVFKAQKTLVRYCLEEDGSFTLQLRDVGDDGLAEAAMNAAIEAMFKIPDSEEPSESLLSYDSGVYSTPYGPSVFFDAADATRAEVTALIDAAVTAITAAGVTTGTLARPRLERGDPFYSGKRCLGGGTPDGIELQIFTNRPTFAKHMASPHFLEEALRWVTAAQSDDARYWLLINADPCKTTRDQLEKRLSGPMPTLRIQAVSGAFDSVMRSATISCTLNDTLTLSELGDNAPAYKDTAVELQQVARRLTPTYDYASIDFPAAYRHDFFNAPRPRAYTSREFQTPPRYVYRHIHEPAWFQVLSPTHIQALGAPPKKATEINNSGFYELTRGQLTDWAQSGSSRTDLIAAQTTELAKIIEQDRQHKPPPGRAPGHDPTFTDVDLPLALASGPHHLRKPSAFVGIDNPAELERQIAHHLTCDTTTAAEIIERVRTQIHD